VTFVPQYPQRPLSLRRFFSSSERGARKKDVGLLEVSPEEGGGLLMRLLRFPWGLEDEDEDEDEGWYGFLVWLEDDEVSVVPREPLFPWEFLVVRAVMLEGVVGERRGCRVSIKEPLKC
jgi:hypothetical protein